MDTQKSSERPTPMANVIKKINTPSTSNTTLRPLSKLPETDRSGWEKKKKMDTEEWSILYNELEGLMNPSGDRLKAGGGGNSDVLAVASHEKFCCCPSAQCYSCLNGSRAKSLNKNAPAIDEGPQSFWRVPNECPCFGANPTGEVRGNRSRGGEARVQCNSRCCHPTSSWQFRYPNYRLPLPLPKLALHLPTTSTNCYIGDELDKPYDRPPPFKASIYRRHRHRQLISKGLGKHFGVLQSTVTLKNNDSLEQIIRFSSYLKAMASIYLHDVKNWMQTDLDRFLEEGQQHLLMLMNAKQNRESSKEIIPSEASACKMFDFKGHKFLIELEDNKYWQALTPKELHNELGTLLKTKYTYVLLQIQHWYILIWRDRNMYFVLDLNGRNRFTLKSDPDAYKEDNAVATLFCVRHIINVVHLIVNMSNLQADEPYLIRKMMVAELETPDITYIIPRFRTKSDYVILNDNYAYLRSNLHLSLDPEKSKNDHRALSVGIATMIATKIDHPATWDSKTLDTIICYGVQASQECLEICYDFYDSIEKDKYSHCLQIGKFIANFRIEPSVYKGLWKCRPNSKETEFDSMLREALVKEEFLFFEINQQMYSIWKKKGFYYLFDPYRHYTYEPIEDDKVNGIKRSRVKSASVHMFRSVDALINLLHDILLLSNRTSSFYIHALQINWLELKNQEIILRLKEGVKPVESLNEFLLFEKNYDKCFQELSQISDYEDDLVSEISSIISIATSDSFYPEGEQEEDMEGESESDLEFGKVPKLKDKKNVYATDSKTKVKRYMMEKDLPKREVRRISLPKFHKSIFDNLPWEPWEKADKKKEDEYEYNHQFTDQLSNFRETNLHSETPLNEKYKEIYRYPSSSENAKVLVDKPQRQSSLSCGKKSKVCERRRVSFDPNFVNDNSTNRNSKSKKSKSKSSDVESKTYHRLVLTCARHCCYQSVSKLLNYALRCADRVLIQTDFGNYVIFFNSSTGVFYLYEGCSCDLDRFRYWNLDTNTVGLLRFFSLHDIICYITDARDLRSVENSFQINHHRCEKCSFNKCMRRR